MRSPRPFAWLCALALAAVLATPYVVSRPGRAAVSPAAAAPTTAVRYAYEIVREFPHDPEAVTQGLIYRDGFLYESTGLAGHSSLRKVRLETGEVVAPLRDSACADCACGDTQKGQSPLSVPEGLREGLKYYV